MKTDCDYIYLKSLFDVDNLNIFEMRTYQDLHRLKCSNLMYDIIVVMTDVDFDAFPHWNLKISDQDLEDLKMRLMAEGHLVIVTENKYGIKKFGKADPGTGYCQNDWERRIRDTGYKTITAFYPFPNAEYPQYVYSDLDMLTKDQIEATVPYYPFQKNMFFSEYDHYIGLLEAGLFPKLANAFIFDCGLDDACKPIVKTGNVTYMHDEINPFPVDEKALITKRYFASEYVDVKNDLVVYEKQRLLRDCLMDILKEVLKICSENNLRVYPFYGTLLGVVRHNGMIPWDEDVDLVMFRSDYEKFMSIAETILEYPYRLVDLSKYENGYIGSHLRVMNVESTYMEANNSWGLCMDDGVYIDIIPLDNTYSNPIQLEKKTETVSKYKNLLRCKLYNYERVTSFYNHEQYEAFRLDSEQYEINFLQQMIVESCIEGEETSEKIGIFTSNRRGNSVDLIERNFFSKTRYLRFEDVELETPTKFNSFLAKRYGKNYMAYPPIQERKSRKKHFFVHNVPYVKYQEVIFKKLHDDEWQEFILFGAGIMTLDFICHYSEVINVVKIVDNDPSKWGKKLIDISYYSDTIAQDRINMIKRIAPDLLQLKIESPSCISACKEDRTLVVISNSFFMEIEDQLKRDFKNSEYAIYVHDPNQIIY